jgi:hypothetical protein
LVGTPESFGVPGNKNILLFPSLTEALKSAKSDAGIGKIVALDGSSPAHFPTRKLKI